MLQRLLAVAMVVAGIVWLAPVPPANAAWPGEVAVCTAPTTPGEASVVPDGSGGVIIAWTEARNPTSYDPDEAVWAQRIDASGTALWPTDGRYMVPLRNYSIARHLDYYSRQHWLAGDGQGGIWVTFVDTGGGGWVYHRRTDGTADSLQVEAISTYGMDVVSDGAGGVFVAWSGAGGSYSDVYVQHVDSTGTALWTAGGVPVCQAASWQHHTVVVADGSGGAVVAWDDERDGYLTDIYVQRVDASGTPLWTADGVRASTYRSPGVVSDFLPRVARDGTGGFLVSWSINGSPFYVEAQRIDSAGTTLWGNTDVVPLAVAGDHDMIPVGDGGCMIAYAYGDDIRLRRVDANGAPVWTNDLFLCAAPGIQNYVGMTRGEDASAWVIWHDRRNGAKDRYVQGADTTGVILGSPDGDPVDTQPVSSWGYVLENMATIPGTGIVAAYVDTRNGNADIFARMIASSPATAVRPAMGRGVRLGALWPNPAGGPTRIAWSIDRGARVELSVFDLAGRRVRTLARGRFGAGSYSARWDGRDAHGRRVASGVYFVRLDTPLGTRLSRVTMLR